MSVAPSHVLVVRLGSLGDLVHVLPAVAHLRAAWPDARIDWLVEPSHAALLGLVPIVSNVIVLQGRSVGGWVGTRSQLRAHRYDLAIDFQGLVKSAALARLSGARRIVGFDTAALREPAARLFYTGQIRVGEGRHVIEKNLALARSLVDQSDVGPLSDPGPAFPLSLKPSPALETLRTSGITDFALLNPGAAWPNKRWTPERFAAVARWIAGVYGWRSVVLWGPNEQSLAQQIAAESDDAAVAAPQTTVNDILSIAKEARVMVSGDTGPVHLAGAVGCPLVAVFGPTTPARNGPWDDRDVSISKYDACVCHYQRACRRPGDWCLASITVEDVTRAIAQRVSAS